MEALNMSRLSLGAPSAVQARQAGTQRQVSLRSHQGLRLATPGTPQAHLSGASPFPASTAPSLAASSSRRPTVAVVAAAAGVAAAPVAVLPVLKFDGAPAGEAELSLKTARPESAKGLVHRAVITFLQNKRRGTASTLTRSEVRGGGRKPFKQKGTGRARQGSTRTPLRPGGGVVFGPKPCDWTIKMNKKERRLAVGTALQSAAVNMTVVEDISDVDLPLPKTRDFVAALDRWGVDYKKDNTLFVTADLTRNVDLASRNIEKLKVATPLSVNVYDVLRADKLVVTRSGLAVLNRRFSGEFEGDEGEEGAEVILRMVGGSLVLEEEGGEAEGGEGEAEESSEA